MKQRRDFKPSAKVYVGRTRLERPKPVPKKKPLPRWVIWSVTTLITFIILGAFFWLPQIRVATVVVQGTRIEQPEDLEKIALEHLSGSYFYLLPRNSIFIYPAREIERVIKDTYPRIMNVTVQYRSATSILISVVERMPQALWCVDAASCVFLDNTGFAFARAPHFSGSVFFEIAASSTAPKISTPVLPLGEFEGLIHFKNDLTSMLQRVFPDLGVPLAAELGSQGSTIFRIQYPEGQGNWRLMVLRNESPLELLRNIELALTSLKDDPKNTGKTLDYLDARLGQKLFSKFKE